VALFMLAAMPSVVRARFSTPTIGRETMVGEVGSATAALNPEGMVRVREALWQARTNRATPIAEGDPVRVIGVEGLVLQVEPVEPDERPGEGPARPAGA
jgi:membrane-bound serine protease (ClpP class)